MNINWHMGEIGRGIVRQYEGVMYLRIEQTPDTQYSDAQISDYIPQRRNFTLRPPLRLMIRAYYPQPAERMVGTAGFGFWNHPFVPTERGFRIPQALWFFFGAPPNNMQLAKDVAGYGWKAATFNAQRWQFYTLLPTAPLAIPLMNIPAMYDALWPIGQRAIGVTETALPFDLLTTPHIYTIEWHPDRVEFAVDGEVVQVARVGIPNNPLGFIAWIDNQYAVISPKGQFAFGLSRVEEAQSLIIEDIRIELL